MRRRDGWTLSASKFMNCLAAAGSACLRCRWRINAPLLARILCRKHEKCSARFTRRCYYHRHTLSLLYISVSRLPRTSRRAASVRCTLWSGDLRRERTALIGFARERCVNARRAHQHVRTAKLLSRLHLHPEIRCDFSPDRRDATRRDGVEFKFAIPTRDGRACGVANACE